jgi:phage-related baseplate assembly protein
MNTIDFSTLPPPSVVETLDFERILSEMKADLVSREPSFTALVESDPAIKILEVCAYREMIVRARVNDAAKSVLLAYAAGADLDNLAAFYNVARKMITPAIDTTIPPTPAVMESDDALRRRVLLALDGLSTAGAANAYVFHALSVPGVKDASVIGPPTIAPGEVHVYVLPEDAASAPATVLAVAAALNKDTVRPLTDKVSVFAGTVSDYEIRATLYLYAGPDAQTVLANACAKAAAFAADNFRLGRDITLSGTYAALHVPGVQRVELASPVTTIVNSPAQCSRCGNIVLTLGGRDD